MIYTALDGTQRCGEVWSAGPLTATAWVRSEQNWAVVSTRTRKQVEYEMPVLMPPQSRARLEWAEEVCKIRRCNPLPEGHIGCDPEYDIARTLWNLAVAQDGTTRAIHAYRKSDGTLADNRWADRASVAAKTLLKLDES